MAANFQVVEYAATRPAGARRLGLTGRLAMDTAREARRALLDHVQDRSAQALWMDLSGLERLDTAGAAVLAEALRAAARAGKRVVLCQPSESALKVFRLAGFEDLLACCCDDPTDAAESLE